jgi:hypothetical protein
MHEWMRPRCGMSLTASGGFQGSQDFFGGKKGFDVGHGVSAVGSRLKEADATGHIDFVQIDQ